MCKNCWENEQARHISYAKRSFGEVPASITFLIDTFQTIAQLFLKRLILTMVPPILEHFTRGSIWKVLFKLLKTLGRMMGFLTLIQWFSLMGFEHSNTS
uniref:Uncharacterized protein n=1 Tax=Lactuca sativa TaxID=4236 RepID=A0A9R1XUZ4_LACSA|nr:hypothetical protein LSAT_V11C100006000 [Lactuca sativa]